MDNWNPLREHFNSSEVNSYNQGAGANLPLEYLAQNKKSNNGTIKAVSLYVKGLPSSFNEIALKNLFANYGDVLKVHLGQNKNHTDHKYGFVDFETLKEAERAITGLNNKVLDNYAIKVTFSKATEGQLKLQTSEVQNGFHDEKAGRAFGKKLNYGSAKLKNTNCHQNSSPASSKTVEIDDSSNNLKVIIPNSNSPISDGQNKLVNTQFFLGLNNKKRPNVPMENASVTHFGLHLSHLVNGNENDCSQMPITNLKPQSCKICNNLAFFICGQCKSAWYCGQNCQFDDWLDHKMDCVRNSNTELSSTKINDILYPLSSVSPSTSENDNQDIIDKRVPYQITVRKPSNNLHGSKPDRKPFDQNSYRDNVLKPLRRPKIELTKAISSATSSKFESNIPPSVLTCGVLTVGQEITLMVVWRDDVGGTICCSMVEGCNIKDIESKLNADQNKDVIPSNLVSKGDVIAALAIEYGMWYRAIVIGCKEKTHEVFYVDFGNTETVEKVSKLSIGDIETPSYLLIAKSDESQDYFKEIEVNTPLRGKLISLSQTKAIIEVVLTENSKTQLICYPWNQGLEMCKKTTNNSGELELTETSTVTNDMSFKENLKLQEFSLSSCDDGESVYVVSITSPDELYLQKTAESDKMDKLSTLIRGHCEQNKIPNKVLPNVGCFVCARLGDFEWYRAKVLSIDNVSNMVSVFLVDFGKKDLVNVKDIKPLPSAAYSFAAFAYRASLHLVPKLTDEQSKLLTSKEWKLKVEEIARKPEKNPAIKLFNEKFCINDFINEHLPPLNSNNVVPEACNIKSGTNSNLEHSIETSLDTTVPSEIRQNMALKSIIMVDDIPKCQLVVGEKVNLVINHYQNPHYICCMKLDEKSVSSFQKLTIDIETFSKNIQPNPNFTPIEGQVVLAKYSNDALWYRAVTLEVTLDEAYLFFLDYGNLDKVKIGEMIPLPSLFSTIQSQVVATALNDIKDNEEWELDDMETLKAIFIRNQNMIECFVEKYNDLDDFYTINIESPNVNDFLISKDLKIVKDSLKIVDNNLKMTDKEEDEKDEILRMKQEIEVLKLQLSMAKKS